MFGKLAVNFFGNNLCALVGMKRDRCTPFVRTAIRMQLKRTLLNNSLFLIMVISYMMFVMLLFE